MSTTQLTPNSQSVSTMTGTSAMVAFQIQPADTTYWSPTVSTSFTTVQNSADKGNDVVTFCKGLTVTLSPQTGGAYVLLLSGSISDSEDVYPISGLVIGTYTPS